MQIKFDAYMQQERLQEIAIQWINLQGRAEDFCFTWGGNLIRARGARKFSYRPR